MEALTIYGLVVALALLFALSLHHQLLKALASRAKFSQALAMSASASSLSAFNPKSLPLCVSRPASVSVLPPSLSFKLHSDHLVSIFASSALKCSSPAEYPSRFVRNVAVSSDFEVEEDDMFADGDDSAPVERNSFSPDLKLFVGNLSFNVDSAQLAQLFESAGNVEMVEVR
jgi:hypothetical protein